MAAARPPGRAADSFDPLTGHPAVVAPAGFQESGSRAGTPVIVSFIGQLYGEADLLRVAKAWQDATDHHLRRPPGFEV